MNWGEKTGSLLFAVALTGCTAATKQVEIRPVGDRSAALAGGSALAVGRAHLAMGDVGLAIEAFRTAQRAAPNDPAPLSGLGDCYAAMHRYDIAQSSYEAALALAPHDPQLLYRLATAFEWQGEADRAAQARTEAAAAYYKAPASAAQISKAEAVPAQTLADAAPSVGSITVKLPPARPVVRQEATPVVAQAALAPAAGVAQAFASPVPILAEAAVAPRPVVQAPVVARASVTAQLPLATQPAVLVSGPLMVEPRAVEALPATRRVATTLLADLQRSSPADRPQKGRASQTPLEAIAPRLERLSTGEVALVTTGHAPYGQRLAAQVPVATPLRAAAQLQTASALRSVTLKPETGALRWVALLPQRPNVQVVNAARTQGLAAAARATLHGRGWRKIQIADGPNIEAKSVVLYSRKRAALGRSLAAQFGVKARPVDADVLVLVLGRDSLGRINTQRRA